MRRFFGEKDGDKILIKGDEFNHLKNVLRLKVGEEIIVSLNTKYEYVCEIFSIGKGVATCKIDGETECLKNPTKNIVLFQAVAKKPKFEFIVQKATEIGMNEIVPFMSEYCIALQAVRKNDCAKNSRGYRCGGRDKSL